MSEGKFWMLYRAGGHAPAFKHESIDGARSEARRVAHVSGSKVFVLESVEAIEFTRVMIRDASPTAKPQQPQQAAEPPTDREVEIHASLYEIPNMSGWGLWLCVAPNSEGRTVAVKCWGRPGEPVVPRVTPGFLGRNGGMACTEFPAGTRWYPLRADGSPIPTDDIPF